VFIKNLFLGIQILLRDCINMIFVYFPGVLGNVLRYWYYKRKLGYLGKGAIIDFGVHIINPDLIHIGENTHIDRWVTLAAGEQRIGNHCIKYKLNPRFKYELGVIHIDKDVHIAPYSYLLGGGGIQIGSRCGIAARSIIFSVSQHYSNLNNPNDKKYYYLSNRVPDRNQSIIIGPIVLENNVAVGTNSVIFPGITIGENSWVGVLSCVTRNIPPNIVVMGCPARMLKSK